MPDSNPITNDFLSQITAIVEENISDEQFGVSELASAMNMSRSNLLRKVKKLTNLSVSQLISQVRLKRGMELLRNSSLNVSEVSDRVGFNSVSYFIKCFREYYGFSPGEAGKRAEGDPVAFQDEPAATSGGSLPPEPTNRRRKVFIFASVGLIVALAVGLLGYYKSPSTKSRPLEKSIAVLPFKNDSNDSTNIYLINGLMETTLNNLQQIKDLRVISRTSAEKYRNTSMSVPEMAKELNVSYFVEGSGQKIGDQIVLNIQLIEAASDRHLWARQYKRETKDIFQLQQEIAINIAKEIKAIITADEEKRIEKNPTDGLVAYDLYLKGKDLFYSADPKKMEASVPYFKKAIARDNEFALAYATATMVCYYLDIFLTEKKYATEVSSYADKALLFDPKLAESLIAKAMSYMYLKEYESAAPYLEKALEYNPNSVLALNFLSDFYNYYIPNTAKYLEYALKGLKLNIASHDSATTSHIYLHAGNAFLNAGFIDDAEKNIDKSLEYKPANSLSKYIKILIQYAKNKNLDETKRLLGEELNKDSRQFILLQEIGKVCFYMRDYDSSYWYFKRFVEMKEAMHLDLFEQENLKIAMVLDKAGRKKETAESVTGFKNLADKDRSIYKHFKLAFYYAYLGDTQKSIAHLKLFSKEDNYEYWVLYIEMDPILDPVRNHPEFKKTMRELEIKFLNNQKKTRIALEEKGLM